MRNATLLAALVCGTLLGCRTVVPMPAADEDPIALEAAAAHFPDENHGEFKVRLRVRNPQARGATLESISWEVWLKNRWFAAGTQALTEPMAPSGSCSLSLSLPVSFRDLPVSADRTAVDVGLRGTLSASYSGTVVRIPFAVTKRIEAVGLPILDAPSEE